MNFTRTAFIITAFAFLSAGLSSCGFKPMHTPNGFGTTGLSYNDLSIRADKNNKIDFLLKQALRDRIGEHTKTRYILSISPKIRQGGLGRSADNIASRYDLTLTTKFKLIDAKTGKTVYKDSVITISTYDAPLDPYGKITTENNKIEQTAVEAADRILTRLARFNFGK